MTYSPHFHGPIDLVVVGENNIVIRLENGERRTVPFLAPPRPPLGVIGRSKELLELKRCVFSGGSWAVRGMPGVGKTSLVLALAYDEEVLVRFSDGILWSGLGRRGNALAALGRWALAMGVSSQDIASAATLESRSKLVHAAIGMRRMLLYCSPLKLDTSSR